MKIEYRYTVEVPDQGETYFTARDASDRILSIINTEIERIITDEIFGPYAVPDIRPIKSTLGIMR
jgi:hypothetical protein